MVIFLNHSLLKIPENGIISVCYHIKQGKAASHHIWKTGMLNVMYLCLKDASKLNLLCNYQNCCQWNVCLFINELLIWSLIINKSFMRLMLKVVKTVFHVSDKDGSSGNFFAILTDCFDLLKTQI